MLIYNL